MKNTRSKVLQQLTITEKYPLLITLVGQPEATPKDVSTLAWQVLDNLEAETGERVTLTDLHIALRAVAYWVRYVRAEVEKITAVE